MFMLKGAVIVLLAVSAHASDSVELVQTLARQGGIPPVSVGEVIEVGFSVHGNANQCTDEQRQVLRTETVEKLPAWCQHRFYEVVDKGFVNMVNISDPAVERTICECFTACSEEMYEDFACYLAPNSPRTLKSWYHYCAGSNAEAEAQCTDDQKENLKTNVVPELADWCRDRFLEVVDQGIVNAVDISDPFVEGHVCGCLTSVGEALYYDYACNLAQNSPRTLQGWYHYCLAKEANTGCQDKVMGCSVQEARGKCGDDHNKKDKWRRKCVRTCGYCGDPRYDLQTEACANDDAAAIDEAAAQGHTIGGCSDVSTLCNDDKHGDVVKQLCPAACGVCQASDDDDTSDDDVNDDQATTTDNGNDDDNDATQVNCDPTMVSRRRREENMCSCRRRDGTSAHSCVDDMIVQE